jgi:ubiquitin-activating enzyme E1 C
VASTNAVIAAVCALEVVKVATACADGLKNYMYFDDADGIYTYAYEQDRKEDCLVCNRDVKRLEMNAEDKLKDLLDTLVEKYQVRTTYMLSYVFKRSEVYIFFSDEITRRHNSAERQKQNPVHLEGGKH